MFSVKIHQNQKQIHQNTHLQTLCETFLQTYTYSNLTLPNLWRVTNLVFGGVSFHFWNKKRTGYNVFDELSIK